MRVEKFNITIKKAIKIKQKAKMHKKINNLLIILVAVVAFALIFAASISTKQPSFSLTGNVIKNQDNLSIDASKASEAIGAAKANIKEMQDAGFNLSRVNDTLQEAEILYAAQLALENKSGSANYASVIEKANSIATIEQAAFLAKDELTALNDKFAGVDKNVNLTEALALLQQAKENFADERYEQVLQLVDQTYQKIDEAVSNYAREKAFYAAASKSIGNFFRQNWKIIIAIVAVCLIITLVTKNRIEKAAIKNKIKRLELERKVLQNLIAETQKNYFERRKLSENEYHIKINEFSELIRDIDRQTPLLRAELAKKGEGLVEEKTKTSRKIPVPKPKKKGRR